MKKLLSSYIISLVFSFMLVIYEPIIMYTNNADDFWFDINMIKEPLLKNFIILFIGLSILFTVIYIINRIFSKKTIFYNICLIIFFVGFICTYIQGNYLVGNLPALDGSTINWSNYVKEDIISIILWIIVVGLTIFSCIKFKTDKVVKCTGLLSIVVFIMLFSSFITVIMTTKGLNTRDVSVIPTDKDIDTASTDENFFIFLLDAVDSVTLDDVMSNDEDFKDVFNDFTYYKDTISAYPFTRDSIPFVISGIWNNNEKDFNDYSTYAYDNSKLLKELDKRNYLINIYEEELKWDSMEALKVNNLAASDYSMDYKKYMKEQARYVLFKYLPFPLKKYVHIENLDFNNSKVIANFNPFEWSNISYYSDIKNNKINKIDKKYFQFLHIEGGHVPYNQNKNVELISNGTYPQKVEACLTIIKEWINRLKENGVYDNSNIIILADHGYNYEYYDGRQNPMLFIKGINEHHEMYRSELPISYEDLNQVYLDLLGGNKSDQLFKNIDENRERRYLWYKYGEENHMVEYIQTGKAWDETTLVPTGKEFNR